MLGSQTEVLQQVLALINGSIAGHDIPGVQITQVNVRLPDNHTITLTWEPEAIRNEDDTFTGDWVVTSV